MNALPLTTSALLLSLLVMVPPSWAGPPSGDQILADAGEMHYLNEAAPSALPHEDNARGRSDQEGTQKKWKASPHKEDYSLDYSSMGKRKVTRMSDEQKRALRRQINDARHDIYLTGN